ncbi:putative Ferric-chelate reductase 1 [Hypsibius exemplaris]|uniref:Ferric-chelate reductase 1 n=1 Tax=Hypsibius exemplaris TaxID=2072580 RepID=A0A9X6NQY7_HYPEX|nr:putative Ferric-chelate reductase 1 [Hypsibius exemplaris]
MFSTSRRMFLTSLIVVQAAISLRVCNAEETVCPEGPPPQCEVDEPNGRTTCLDGTWPTDASNDPAFQIPSTTQYLFLRNIKFPIRENSYRLSHLIHLTDLVIQYSESCEVTTGATVPFLFQDLVASLDRSTMRRLIFYDINLQTIDDDFFAGFSGLESVEFYGCPIKEFTHRAFNPLAMGAPVSGLPGARNTSSFKTLQVLQDEELTEFAWEVLYPVAESLEVISFSAENLAEITYTPPIDSFGGMFLNRLTQLEIWETHLTTLPESVLNTITGAANAPVNLNFLRNKNICSDCINCSNCELVMPALRPLVNWASGSDFRTLRGSCLSATQGLFEFDIVGNSWDCIDKTTPGTPTTDPPQTTLPLENPTLPVGSSEGSSALPTTAEYVTTSGNWNSTANPTTDRQSDLPGPSNGRKKAHAILMVIAWNFLVTIGVLTARQTKNIYPNKRPLNGPVWFIAHRTLMSLAVVLTLSSIIIIIVDVGGWRDISHAYLGVITFSLAMIQPFIAVFFRPHLGNARRYIFNYFHWTLGRLTYLLSVVTMFLGARLPVLGVHEAAAYLILTCFIVNILLQIGLEVNRHRHIFNARVPPLRPNEFPIDSAQKILLIVDVIFISAITISVIVLIAVAPLHN